MQKEILILFSLYPQRTESPVAPDLFSPATYLVKCVQKQSHKIVLFVFIPTNFEGKWTYQSNQEMVNGLFLCVFIFILGGYEVLSHEVMFPLCTVCCVHFLRMLSTMFQ